MEERRAVERLKKDDIGGLEELVNRHQTRAVRAAYLITRERALAEDVVQAAFVRAYERIGRFDVERPFGPWFMKIVVNDAVKAASRRERAVPLEGRDTDDPLARLADPETGPQELAEEAEERRRVWAALEKLPPAQRAAVVRRYYLGMSEAETAESGKSQPGTIKWRLHAARKALSKLLRPQFRAEDAPVAVPLDAQRGGSDVTEQRKRIEKALRGCAEMVVPDTVDLWPAIRERVTAKPRRSRRPFRFAPPGQVPGDSLRRVPKRRLRMVSEHGADDGVPAR